MDISTLEPKYVMGIGSAYTINDHLISFHEKIMFSSYAMNNKLC